MGAAAVDRLVAQSRSKRRKSRWPRKFRNLRDQMLKEVEEVRLDAKAVENTARAQVAERDDLIKTMYDNAPGLVEIIHVKQSNIISRLWWAIGFAITRRFRIERSA